VWNWRSKGNTPPVLVAWRNPGEWHWFLHEDIKQTFDGPGKYAAIVTTIGAVVFSNQGRSLTIP